MLPLTLDCFFWGGDLQKRKHETTNMIIIFSINKDEWRGGGGAFIRCNLFPWATGLLLSAGALAHPVFSIMFILYCGIFSSRK